MRVDFLGGPLNGKSLLVRYGTRSIACPVYQELRAVWHAPEDEVPYPAIPYVEYKVIPLFGSLREATGVLVPK